MKATFRPSINVPYTLVISSDEESSDDADTMMMDMFENHVDTTEMNGCGLLNGTNKIANEDDELKENSDDTMVHKLADLESEILEEARRQTELGNLDEFECAFQSIDEAEETEHLLQVRVHAKFCTRCGTGFVQQKSLNAHLAQNDCSEKNYTGDMPLTCSICGQGFVQQFCLRQHSMRHAQTKPFKCKVCCRSFVTLRSLFKHYQTHKDYRPFTCELCPKQYFSVRNLAKHKRIHAGRRPFMCKICPRKFNKSKRLLLHMQEHAKKKPFKCKFCNRKYKQCSMRNLHMRTHTKSRSGEWNFLCEVCGLTHIRTKSLWLSDIKKHEDTMSALRKALVQEMEKREKDQPPRRQSSDSVEIIEDPLQIVIDLADD